jgi:hypothetical protein
VEIWLKDALFWDVTPCGSCKDLCFGGIASYGYVPSSPILVTLMMEALSSSETSVLTRATRHNMPDNTILEYNPVLWHVLKWLCVDLHVRTHVTPTVHKTAPVQPHKKHVYFE